MYLLAVFQLFLNFDKLQMFLGKYRNELLSSMGGGGGKIPVIYYFYGLPVNLFFTIISVIKFEADCQKDLSRVGYASTLETTLPPTP